MAHSITRWEPFAELAEMRSRFDRLLSDVADGRDREWMPAIDMIRDNGDLVVRAEVPGIKPEEIEIEAEGGVLTISGKHEETSEEKGKEFVRRERRYGAFTRSMPLPEGVDPKKIKATTSDGVLELTIPLPKEAAAEPVKITPTAGGG
ncbi:MAG TPA: Hsp20/alpha crystallin family protein [Solirubrobacteraceae bacterium]|nr:Hsp20/alpha crystallin family protein [Solirubrobacteraceae bacterium]